MENYDISGDNIIIDKNDRDNDDCTWRGILMDDKKQLELFGIIFGDCQPYLEEGLLVIDGYYPEDDETSDATIFVNGESLKEAILNYIRFLKLRKHEHHSFSIYEIEEFGRVEPIPSTFNIPLILLFNAELDLYFKTS